MVYVDGNSFFVVLVLFLVFIVFVILVRIVFEVVIDIEERKRVLSFCMYWSCKYFYCLCGILLIFWG